MASERLRRQLMQTSVYKMEMARNDAEFGHPEGIKVGQCFENRAALRRAGVHKNNYAGISVCKRGANAIVLSRGYEYYNDDGDEIILQRAPVGLVDPF
ncbi:hypothetical protein MPER_11075 [Moniliophthora perniciosa FA553]|nr:hypothetical protein MPER_11075 [Moniliophthora perniciosa FA553]